MFSDIRDEAECADGRKKSIARFDRYLAWSTSNGTWRQRRSLRVPA
jgi:hypothetical protein